MSDQDLMIIGLSELEKTFINMAHLDPGKIEQIELKGAKMISSKARDNVKKGPTGNLKRAQVAKILERRGDLPAPAIAAVDRKKAPHYHLVEYGHALVRNKKTIGHVPAHPFFRPAVDTEGPKALDTMETGISLLIEEAMTK